MPKGSKSRQKQSYIYKKRINILKNESFKFLCAKWTQPQQETIRNSQELRKQLLTHNKITRAHLSCSCKTLTMTQTSQLKQAGKSQEKGLLEWRKSPKKREIETYT
jgi:hypothetical protein